MESIRKTLRRLTNSLRLFRRSEDGNYMVFVGIAAIPMVAAAGLGVDVARGFLAEARLQAAVDAAAIAMGSADGTDDEIKALGRMFFYANFPSDFWATPGNLDIQVTRVVPSDPDSRPESFVISATAEVDTLFFRMLPYAGEATQAQREAAINSGYYDTIDVRAGSTALTEVQGLEVVMVLDVTGSMYSNYSSGERRIEAMRDAALNMVNILFGEIEEPELLKVAIVPYNTAVNIGTDMHSYVLNDGLNSDGTPAAVNPFGQTDWYGCVQARRDDHDLEDVFVAGATDGSGEWEAYRWPIEPDRRNASSPNTQYNYCETRADHTTGDYYRYEDPLTVFEQSAADQWDDSAIPPNQVNGTRFYDRDTDGPNKGCPGALLPLTNNRAAIWDYLQNVTVVDRNGTITATGLVWGWRVISPGEPFTTDLQGIPLAAYNNNDWQKAIIVLTDGTQELRSIHQDCDRASYVTQPLVDQPPLHGPWEFDPATRNMNGIAIDEGPDARWTAYGYVHELDSRPLGTGHIRTILETRLGDTCDAIKAVPDPVNGGSAIDIFSITFGDSAQPGTTISTMMSDCTTDPQNNYFHAPDTATLNAAFEEIARQLTSLRLTD